VNLHRTFHQAIEGDIMKARITRLRTAATALVAAALALPAQSALAKDIYFRSFSAAEAMGPPAEEFGAKLQSITNLTLGPSGEVRFVKLPGIPAIPSVFKGDIVAAVGAGAAGGGFDAAYNSGSELNKAWGFLFNSGVPFGPGFDEYLGFLYGKSVDDGQRTGLELAQSILDLNNRNVVVVPIVGNAEQLSGYFFEPIGDAGATQGIGLAGLCQRNWTFRYLPPGEYTLNRACDDLVASGVIPAKNLKFIAPIPGGGSLVDAVKNGYLQGFEFATPLDDVSSLFNTADNPGTVGVRYVHFPGWQQQFLITWMIINKQVWDSMSLAQQTLTYSVARDHVLSSYGENMRRQGAALKYILEANRYDADPNNDLVLVEWPKKDQELMIASSIRMLNDRVYDASLSPTDRRDYKTILEALRKYVEGNDIYWDDRKVGSKVRFKNWTDELGQKWETTLVK
jgi:hypothetical protein